MIEFHREARRLNIALATSTACLALAMAAPAWAQDSAEREPPVAASQDKPVTADERATDDIVVTGTLLRGIAPVGTNVVGLDREQITATGATNTNDVLAKIPQISNFFNSVVNTGLGNLGSVSARPNIRNLNTFGGGNTTLLLVDGQRVAGVGVIYTSPDPDVVPPGALDRVEVVADGGSSIYGSDAVGGVINLITRRRFEGLEVSGRAGFADDYYQYDGTLTAGTQWSTGGAYASFTYSKHDDLFGRDRDYIRSATLSNSCAPGTLTGTTTYALPANFTGTGAGLVPGTANSCDTSDDAAWVPAERRYSVFGGFNQQLSDGVDFNVRGYYTNRRTDLLRDAARTSLLVPATNPFYASAIGGTQQVAFSYAPVFGPNLKSRTNLEQWGVTPSIDARLGGSWKLRASAGYSESDVLNVGDALNPVAQANALAGTTTATALNPYNIAATNPAVLAGIRNFEEYSRGRQNVTTARAVLDGTLFSWAGGDVRVAIGGEYLREEITSTFGQRVPGDAAALFTDGGKRNIKSVYGEILLPLFGEENRTAGFHSLLVSGSARYDHYSDVGGTFNPKIGMTWQPFSALTLRGNYGTSFNAPSLADTNAVDERIEVNLGQYIFLLAKPGDLVFPFPGIFTINRPVLVVAGGNPDLKPQTADTFSVGFDFEPPFARGLKLSATYWNVDFRNQISLPTNCLLNPSITYTATCQRFVNDSPTIAEVNAAAPGVRLSGQFPSLDAIYANPLAQPYVLFDARRVNIGRVQTDGVDFNASLFKETSFGSLNANVGGTYALSRYSRFLNQGRVDEYQSGVSQLNLTAGLGAKIGDFGATATLYHTGGYDLARTATGPGAHIESFDVVNLFFSYDVEGEGLANGLSFTLSVNNVFDNDPPFINAGSSYTNGSTLGRLIQIGVSKKF